MLIHAASPIRICDLGGWTDTWFAEHGQVLNIAVRPCVHVQLRASPRLEEATASALEPSKQDVKEGLEGHSEPTSFEPLVKAAIRLMDVPDDYVLTMTVRSEAPAGSSTGTSASVCCAAVAALSRLLGRELDRYAIAIAAHRIETELLDCESGIQDQLAAVFGGVNSIEIDQYPHASATRLSLNDEVRKELERRLSLVYVGQAHRSSDVHVRVIDRLRGAGPDAPELRKLRQTAVQAKEALLASDLQEFGLAMIENTTVQSELHESLVSRAHQKIIDIAIEAGAWGWKVNGAGGDGGSVAILHQPLGEAQVATLKAIGNADPKFRIIPISLDLEGVRVWDVACC